MKSKKCRTCGWKKDVKLFHSDKRQVDKLETECKSCKKKKAKIKRREKAQEKLDQRISSIPIVDRPHTVYGYVDESTGLFKYIGCTSRPEERRWEHERDYDKLSYSRYSNLKGFRYFIFISGISFKDARDLERSLIIIHKLNLDNKTVPSVT